ncbi:MAG TPA: phospholipid carrier-dependent glycosyltransferase [Candidatus Binatia bacterium]
MRNFIQSPAVTISPDTATAKLFAPNTLPRSARWLSWSLSAAVIAILFYQLGAAALFEPDEGRNAEKAREILVLDDWVTPHENFHSVLDKPIFFYWLIALAYSLFGVSEWAARLPSALAALACIALVYRFAQLRWGRWAALWSALILVTSFQFFVLARVVILDMTLTFFLTLALCSFYEAAHTESAKRRRIASIAMYLALAGATLIKGLIGVAVPGMVIFAYLLVRKQWAVLRRIDLIPGAVLFLAIVLPWYLIAEARNPGYLYYYFWEEHFGRFATTGFDRAQPWYYFIGVGSIGFFPWSLLLPLAVNNTWQQKLDNKTLYLILWIILPFLFFSVSKSKLPHYILPIFPPLAMLAASALVRLYQESPAKLQFALSLTWWFHTVAALYLAAGSFFPGILARQIRTSISDLAYLVWIYSALSAAMLVYLARRTTSGQPPTQRRLYVLQALSSCFYLVLVVQVVTSISPDRSAKAIAAKILPRLTATTQVASYDTYLAGLPFYLRSERPLWVVTYERKKRSYLGNYYAVGNRKDPVSAWGTAIIDFEEFRERWNTTEKPLLIVVKEKNLTRFVQQVGQSPIRLGAADEYLLVTKPSAAPSRGPEVSKRTE